MGQEAHDDAPLRPWILLWMHPFGLGYCEGIEQTIEVEEEVEQVDGLGAAGHHELEGHAAHVRAEALHRMMLEESDEGFPQAIAEHGLLRFGCAPAFSFGRWFWFSGSCNGSHNSIRKNVDDPGF